MSAYLTPRRDWKTRNVLSSLFYYMNSSDKATVLLREVDGNILVRAAKELKRCEQLTFPYMNSQDKDVVFAEPKELSTQELTWTHGTYLTSESGDEFNVNSSEEVTHFPLEVYVKLRLAYDKRTGWGLYVNQDVKRSTVLFVETLPESIRPTGYGWYAVAILSHANSMTMTAAISFKAPTGVYALQFRMKVRSL